MNVSTESSSFKRKLVHHMEEVADFFVHMLIGVIFASTLFLAAVIVGWVAHWADLQLADEFVKKSIIFLERAIVGVDITLFLCYLIKSSLKIIFLGKKTR
ncbi:hypothetical protein R5576_15205 [Xanthomonas euvesicatoria]|uniref:Uncharacterized protein n=1 Tax=Xanthomonas euvesicatoria TaxID=456327 RepID=A0AAX4FM54_XANEU|nr:hypothetical protein [Xanthomonas euvesicatoria]WOP49277.1 hypothetical protein R2B60_06030 [Xanthomonas euvesicatoria]WOP51430.1 hypothetical protein R5576_15205 [Xanthomonas euvesicatoria]WOP57733.1 hypothetical protein R5577_06220 [Xanthomonas euvesicatoria]